jgi:hypothetical protein
MRRLLLLLLLLGVPAWGQEPGVVSIITAEGWGDPAEMGDELAIAYKMRLANGDLLDATPEGKTYQLTLGSNKVIPGMTQGLLGVRRGESRKLVIPPSLGYGSRKMGPIPPDSTLHFEVEVLYLTKTDHEHEGDADAHDHDHDGVPDHDTQDHASGSSREGFENRPDAQHLDKPAIFEYLIRDFFTRPWRYQDASDLVWKANSGLTLLALLAWIAATALERGTRGGFR